MTLRSPRPQKRVPVEAPGGWARTAPNPYLRAHKSAAPLKPRRGRRGATRSMNLRAHKSAAPLKPFPCGQRHGRVRPHHHDPQPARASCASGSSRTPRLLALISNARRPFPGKPDAEKRVRAGGSSLGSGANGGSARGGVLLGLFDWVLYGSAWTLSPGFGCSFGIWGLFFRGLGPGAWGVWRGVLGFGEEDRGFRGFFGLG